MEVALKTIIIWTQTTTTLKKSTRRSSSWCSSTCSRPYSRRNAAVFPVAQQHLRPDMWIAASSTLTLWETKVGTKARMYASTLYSTSQADRYRVTMLQRVGTMMMRMTISKSSISSVGPHVQSNSSLAIRRAKGKPQQNTLHLRTATSTVKTLDKTSKHSTRCSWKSHPLIKR